mmetsp:Transcript_87561/g.252833  ORF Transcript_87561/g.252833 Transcript_87561/m.252833 type:complete len:353 (-) Transcript_87561:51-1109(-)
MRSPGLAQRPMAQAPGSGKAGVSNGPFLGLSADDDICTSSRISGRQLREKAGERMIWSLTTSFAKRRLKPRACQTMFRVKVFSSIREAPAMATRCSSRARSVSAACANLLTSASCKVCRTSLWTSSLSAWRPDAVDCAWSSCAARLASRSSRRLEERSSMAPCRVSHRADAPPKAEFTSASAVATYLASDSSRRASAARSSAPSSSAVRSRVARRDSKAPVVSACAAAVAREASEASAAIFCFTASRSAESRRSSAVASRHWPSSSPLFCADAAEASSCTSTRCRSSFSSCSTLAWRRSVSSFCSSLMLATVPLSSSCQARRSLSWASWVAASAAGVATVLFRRPNMAVDGG